MGEGGLRSVAVAGGHIEYRWIGHRGTALHDAALPVLVFLHEGLGCVALWRDFPDRVAAATGLPALVYSRIGYGGSSPCALPRPLSYMHDEGEAALPDLLARLGIGRHILIGHSDGASIALVYAGTAPTPDLLGVVAMAPHVICEDVSVAAIRAADRAFAAGELRARLEKYHGDNIDCAFRGWCDSWLAPGFRDWSIEAYLPRIAVPMLVIQGVDDEYGTMRQVERILELAGAGAEVKLLPRCGHSPQRDQPDAVLEAIKTYVGKRVGR